MTRPEAARVDGVVRRYEWGSHTAIQQLLGERPDGRPAAELWFGAHEGSPSPTELGPLDAVVAGDPVGWLGAAVAERFDARLPFLLKVLAAETALSIQVHPTIDQARAGYAAEDAAGVPLDAPHRNYRDRNHKPELLCALTPFEALSGFRRVADVLDTLEQLALPQLDFLVTALHGDDPLRSAFTAVLTHPHASAVADAVAAAAGPDGPLRAAHLAAEHFPGDVGIVVSLLLNHVVLAPGEALYLGAGIVHAYLRGTGIEIMSSSDNVLRCGLTPKHVDVEALLDVVDFVETDDPRWSPVDGAFDVPVPDFRLATSVSASRPDGPRIVLCLDGEVRAAGHRAGAGHAILLAPGHHDIEATGRVFVAECGLSAADSRSAR